MVSKLFLIIVGRYQTTYLWCMVLLYFGRLGPIVPILISLFFKMELLRWSLSYLTRKPKLRAEFGGQSCKLDKGQRPSQGIILTGYVKVVLNLSWNVAAKPHETEKDFAVSYSIFLRYKFPGTGKLLCSMNGEDLSGS